MKLKQDLTARGTVATPEHVDFFNKSFGMTYEQDTAEKIVAGINTFLTGYTAKVIGNRKKFWHRRFDSLHAYTVSVDANRKDLRKMIGATDTIHDVRLVTLGHTDKADPVKASVVGETKSITVFEVKWTVVKNLTSEGLLLVPKGKVKASAVVIPDAGETPEAYAGLKPGPGVALRLAEKGIKVLVPVLVNRGTRYSGNDKLISRNPWVNKPAWTSRRTNETHREWIWRQGYIMGHNIIGMGVQKVVAAVDWLRHNSAGSTEKIGVMGYGTGGLLALYSAALDTHIDAAWISGYFGPRKNLWREPVSRDVWGLLTEFGDAEIASMILPRSLVIEEAPVPSVKEPKKPEKGQENDGSRGELTTPSKAAVRAEVKKLEKFFPEGGSLHPDVALFANVSRHGTEKALKVFTNRLGVHVGSSGFSRRTTSIAKQRTFNVQERQHRVFNNEVDYIQDMIPTAAGRRYAFLKGDYSSPNSWNRSMEPYRERFYKDMVGKIHEKLLPMKPKMRQIYNKSGWKGYEVALKVWPGVYSWGILAVPKGINPGDRRPAVVMQHGIGLLPSSSIFQRSYHHIFVRLVKRGFVVFSPFNPYQFNVRKAHAVKANIFSVIIPQYKQILNFLKSRQYVDGHRIGLYGKSWGGRTALRVPIVLKDLKVAVCTGYFNNWLNKAVSIHYANSYLFSNEIGVYNWNMGNTFTHAEMAELIAPRPFMVVAGYNDPVAAQEMVASEFEKDKRIYDMMGIGDHVKLDFWKGKHEIDIKGGGMHFLQKHLHPPESGRSKSGKSTIVKDHRQHRDQASRCPGFSAMDSHHTGFLGKAETRGHQLIYYALGDIDSNLDGKISRGEYRRWMQKHQTSCRW